MGHLVKGTLYLQWAPGEELCSALSLQKSKAGSKASSSRMKKTATGCIFKRCALGLPGRKMLILAPRPIIQVVAQGVPPAGSKSVPDRPMITSSLPQRKHDATAI